MVVRSPGSRCSQTAWIALRSSYGGGGYGTAPASAPTGAPAGVYLDGRKYMRDTLKLFDGIREKVGFDVELCHDVHERLKPVDAIRFAVALEPYALFFLEDAIPLEEGGSGSCAPRPSRRLRRANCSTTPSSGAP